MFYHCLSFIALKSLLFWLSRGPFSELKRIQHNMRTSEFSLFWGCVGWNCFWFCQPVIHCHLLDPSHPRFITQHNWLIVPPNVKQKCTILKYSWDQINDAGFEVVWKWHFHGFYLMQVQCPFDRDWNVKLRTAIFELFNSPLIFLTLMSCSYWSTVS